MLKKLICLLLGAILLMCIFVGCKNENTDPPVNEPPAPTFTPTYDVYGKPEGAPDYAPDEVIVYIKTEYQDDFDNRKFTVEDFQWENADSIEYLEWLFKPKAYAGNITLYLKDTGEQYVQEAIEHLRTLDFVYLAEVSGYEYLC